MGQPAGQRTTFLNYFPPDEPGACDYATVTRTHQEEVLQKELAIPRYNRPNAEWPRHRAKNRKRKSMRSRLARETQQRIDKTTMKGVV